MVLGDCYILWMNKKEIFIMKRIDSIQPIISIIVTCYKVERFIEDALLSVLNQKVEYIEIIVVNDGSPDKCGQIIDKMATEFKEIKTIHQKNGGPGSARNAGLKCASGEFIFFLDGDDRMTEGLLEEIRDVIDSHPKCDIITSNWHYYTNWEMTYIRKECFQLFGQVTQEQIKLRLACDTYLSHSFYRRTMLMQYGQLFGTEKKLAEDQEWLLNNVHAAKEILILDRAFYYHYESRPDSQVNGFTEDKYLPTLKTWGKMFHDVERLDYSENSKKELYHIISTVFMQVSSRIIIHCTNSKIKNECIAVIQENTDVLDCNFNKWHLLAKIRYFIGMSNMLRLYGRIKKL